MDRLQSVLTSMTNSKILDVATGSGAFLEIIASYVTLPELCIGIDPNPIAIENARKKHPDHPFVFETMDGHALAFPDNYFDIVCISNSLHHMKMPEKVLSEMERVLKPGGMLIVLEMIKDLQNDKQLTHVFMHHYWAEIDMVTGIDHNETFSRDELESLLTAQKSLGSLHKWEINEEDSEPSETPIVEQHKILEDAVMNYLEKTETWTDTPYYVARAEQLMSRLRDVGFEPATECLQIFYKAQER